MFGGQRISGRIGDTFAAACDIVLEGEVAGGKLLIGDRTFPEAEGRADFESENKR
jgi:hypothetical protein